MKKLISSLLATFLLCLIFSAVANAHVEVTPDASQKNAEEVYTVKVPNEKDNPTVKMVLRIPGGLAWESYEPVNGWKTSVQKDRNGRAILVTWMAVNGGIQPGQFQRFSFLAQNPDKDTTLAWDAYQYYQDKSIVEWTGGEKSNTPHATTTVSESTVQGPVRAGSSTNGASVNGLTVAALIVSIAAIILSSAALFVRRK